MASSRNTKKLSAILRARRRLENRLADIDWELDILYPSLKEMEELEAQGEQVEVELEPGDEA